MSPSKPQPKTEVGQVFLKQMERLRLHSEKEDVAIRNQGAPEWFRPEDFEASLFAIEAMHEPFSRAEHEDQFAQVVKDAEQPGTTGDFAMIALQGDFLAAMERAYRDRHMSPVRRRVQVAGRRMGHSAETGVIKLGLVGYIERINQFNKGEFEAAEPSASDVLGDAGDVGGIT